MGILQLAKGRQLLFLIVPITYARKVKFIRKFALQNVFWLRTCGIQANFLTSFKYRLSKQTYK